MGVTLKKLGINELSYIQKVIFHFLRSMSDGEKRALEKNGINAQFPNNDYTKYNSDNLLKELISFIVKSAGVEFKGIRYIKISPKILCNLSVIGDNLIGFINKMEDESILLFIGSCLDFIPNSMLANIIPTRLMFDRKLFTPVPISLDLEAGISVANLMGDETNHCLFTIMEGKNGRAVGQYLMYGEEKSNAKVDQETVDILLDRILDELTMPIKQIYFVCEGKPINHATGRICDDKEWVITFYHKYE